MKWFLRCPERKVSVQYKVCKDECKGYSCKTYKKFVERRVKEEANAIRYHLTFSGAERLRREG